MIRVIKGYDSLVLIFLNPSPNEIPSPTNYRLLKSTKAYDQGQKMLFALNQYPNDHGTINLSQMIKSILGMIN